MILLQHLQVLGRGILSRRRSIDQIDRYSSNIQSVCLFSSPFRHHAAGRRAPRGLHEPDAPLRGGRPDGGVGAEPRHLRPYALARRHATLLEEQSRLAGGKYCHYCAMPFLEALLC